MERWLLHDVYTDKVKKEKQFDFEEFESNWSKLQLFIWGGKEFVSEVKESEYEMVRDVTEMMYLQGLI